MSEVVLGQRTFVFMVGVSTLQVRFQLKTGCKLNHLKALSYWDANDDLQLIIKLESLTFQAQLYFDMSFWMGLEKLKYPPNFNMKWVSSAEMCNSILSNDTHQTPLKLLGGEIFHFKISHNLIYTLYI